MRWFLSRRVWFGYGEKSTRTLVSALGNKDFGANICFIDNTDLQTTSVGGKRDRPVRKAHLQSKSWVDQLAFDQTEKVMMDLK